jgi:NAD+ diphosphatase
MIPAVTYGGCGLDRAARLRADPEWLDRALSDPRTLIVPVSGERSLVLGGDPARAALLPCGSVNGALPAAAPAFALLGVDDSGAAYVAAEWPAAAGGAAPPADWPGIDGASFIELRRVSASLPRRDAGLLAYARGLLHWHRRTRFCGDCGAPTESRSAGHARLCTNPDCGVTHFPRSDPAIIVLVTRPGPGEEVCLLARQHRWPRGLISTLAGFVEPGESVEEAVVREIGEETGVRLTGVHYRGSQPWPFPSSLMLAFRAEAEPGAEIRLDADELETGRWFTRAEVAAIRDFGFKLPTRDSIARTLVDDWLSG